MYQFIRIHESVITCTSTVFKSHFDRFGMEDHASADGKPAKSEILFVAAPAIMYDDPSIFGDEDENGVVRARDLSDVDTAMGLVLLLINCNSNILALS